MSLHNATLLLGSNIKDRQLALDQAKSLLQSTVGPISKQTKVLETEPVEFVSPHKFLNFALEIKTSLSPIQLLKEIKSIEKMLGREKDSKASGKFIDRPIDIDIVYYDSIEFKSKELEIPHRKHVQEREFSMQLLKELTESA